MDEQNFNLLKYLKINWKSSLVILILLAGLMVGVYLVQTEQVFKGKATSDMVEGAFSVTDGNGNTLPYQGNNTYNTDSTHIQLKIKDITPLTQ